MRSLRQVVGTALRQDGVGKDITSKLFAPGGARAKAVLIAKDRGVFAGRRPAQAVLDRYGIRSRWHIRDGVRFHNRQTCAEFFGPARSLLAVERTVLNFIQHLSGVATVTRSFVDRVRGTGVRIFDTRKTIPGLRDLQKDAVLAGGGHNHRRDLATAIFVKDNHWLVWRGSGAGERRRIDRVIRERTLPLIVEATCVEEARQAAAWGADVILLDNMPVKQLCATISRIRDLSKRSGHALPEIEVSGGVCPRAIRQLRRLRIDRVSIGMLTHSVKSIDFSIELVSVARRARRP